MPAQREFRIIDLPDHARPYGFQIVINCLRRQGHNVTELSSGGLQGATGLLSLYWCEDLYAWIRFARRNAIKMTDVVIGGNQATGSPAAVLPFCGGVYRGDGDSWDGLAPVNVYRTDNTLAEPCVEPAIPQECIVMEAKAVARDVFPIMELSRGCRYKCHYCQYAWMKLYREQDASFICAQLAAMKGRVRLASADIPQHSQYGIIQEAAARAGVRIANQDGALFTLAKSQVLGKMQRFGVDGMSDRLRQMVHKPIKADWLVQRISDYSKQGVTRCLAYNIFGLPGETHEDFQEWDDTVRRIVAAVKPPFTWVNSWNAFLPMPMTPLAAAPSSWGSDHRNLYRMAETRIWAKRKGVQVFDMPERCSNATITARMLAVRATAASAHIVSTLAMNPHMPERQVLKEFEAVEGYHLHGAIPATLAVAKEENLNGRP